MDHRRRPDDSNANRLIHDVLAGTPDVDEPDKLPRDLSITYWDLIALVIAIVSHVVDVCIDFNVAYQYYRYEKLTYFVLTVIFIAVPSIINTYMSLKMSARLQRPKRELSQLIFIFLVYNII